MYVRCAVAVGSGAKQNHVEDVRNSCVGERATICDGRPNGRVPSLDADSDNYIIILN